MEPHILLIKGDGSLVGMLLLRMLKMRCFMDEKERRREKKISVVAEKHPQLECKIAQLRQQ